MGVSSYVEHGDEIVFHPGYYILEACEGQDRYRELIDTLGISEVDFLFILYGDRDIDEDIAEGLSKVFGTSKEYWMNIQKTFTEKVKEWENEVV